MKITGDADEQRKTRTKLNLEYQVKLNATMGVLAKARLFRKES